MVNRPAGLGDFEDLALQPVSITFHQGQNKLFKRIALPRGHRAHHAEIDPFDTAVIGQDEDVARMRVGMIETILHELLHIVMGHQIGQVVALIVGQPEAVDFLHARAAREILGQHRRGGVVAVATRRCHALARLVVGKEPLQIVCLVFEIQLFGGGAHHLVNQLLDGQALPFGHHAIVDVDDSLHDGQVVRHRIDDTGTLNLHGNDGAVGKRRLVHLRDGSRPDRILVEIRERLRALFIISGNVATRTPLVSVGLQLQCRLLNHARP